jgi:hypothetical protein
MRAAVEATPAARSPLIVWGCTMKSTRRSFLRLVGAAPLAGKLAAEEAAKSLAGIGAQSLGQAGYASVSGLAPAAPPTSAQIATWLADNVFRSEVESAAYANNRHVSYLDVDLASKKSFSLAAKVTFQRQRNVQREIDGLGKERVSPWSLLYKRMNLFG